MVHSFFHFHDSLALVFTYFIIHIDCDYGHGWPKVIAVYACIVHSTVVNEVNE